MLDLQLVRTFVTIVETGQFLEAAERLRLAQPTVSQHMSRLEEVLGHALMKRNRGGCELTAHGVRFLPYARSLLRLAERAQSTVDRNNLAVGTSSNIGIYMLPLIVREFQKSDSFNGIPDIQIGNNLETIRKLEDSEVDIALMEWWDKRPGFVAKAWRREEVVVIVPQNHPWRRKKRIKKEDLFSQPLVGGEPATGTARLLQDALGVSASSLKVGLTLGSTEAVKRAVMAGLGISVAMLSSVNTELAAGDLTAVRIEGVRLEKELYVVIPDYLPFSAPARRFAEFLLVRFSTASRTL